jgi:hypothetical protein
MLEDIKNSSILKTIHSIKIMMMQQNIIQSLNIRYYVSGFNGDSRLILSCGWYSVKNHITDLYCIDDIPEKDIWLD